VALTPTPVIPATGRLDHDLALAQEALSVARTTADLAGPDARAFGRVSLTVGSAEAVDKLAAAWHARAEWRAGNSQYVAIAGDGSAELEAVWYRPAVPAQNGEAA
jgi:hypothetical protein